MLRRDLILGGLGLGALGLSEALRPRQRLVLLKNATVAEALPANFGAWSSQDTTLVNPAQAGRLARTLYSEIVSRIYFQRGGEAAVMLLIAYGDTQSDLLQLHRPESCYPAVGFNLQESRPLALTMSPGVILPGRRVVATTDERVESIVYWTRLGELLPQSGTEQRTARLENAMRGYVPDGILVRCSALGEVEPAFRMLQAFVPEMMRAVHRAQRPAFVGSKIARQFV
jgi:EpsI family protein